MDAAMTKVRADTEAAVIARMTAVAVAREDVRPIIGQVSLAMDTAAGIYKLALDHLGIDLTDVPPTAYRAVLKAVPSTKGKPAIAMDHAAATNLASRFPGLANIRIQ